MIDFSKRFELTVSVFPSGAVSIVMSVLSLLFCGAAATACPFVSVQFSVLSQFVSFVPFHIYDALNQFVFPPLSIHVLEFDVPARTYFEFEFEIDAY